MRNNIRVYCGLPAPEFTLESIEIKKSIEIGDLHLSAGVKQKGHQLGHAIIPIPRQIIQAEWYELNTDNGPTTNMDRPETYIELIPIP